MEIKIQRWRESVEETGVERGRSFRNEQLSSDVVENITSSKNIEDTFI